MVFRVRRFSFDNEWYITPDGDSSSYLWKDGEIHKGTRASTTHHTTPLHTWEGFWKTEKEARAFLKKRETLWAWTVDSTVDGELFFISKYFLYQGTRYLWKNGTVHHQTAPPNNDGKGTLLWPGYWGTREEAQLFLKEWRKRQLMSVYKSDVICDPNEYKEWADTLSYFQLCDRFYRALEAHNLSIPQSFPNNLSQTITHSQPSSSRGWDNLCRDIITFLANNWSFWDHDKEWLTYVDENPSWVEDENPDSPFPYGPERF